MEITVNLIRAIREKTGAGMTSCKKALVECNGNFDEAVDWLRKKGLAAASQKASRVAIDGLIGVASNGYSSAAMVEVNTETDFVAKNQKFQSFVFDVTVHCSISDITSIDQLLNEKIGDVSIRDRTNDLISVLGENIGIRRIVRLDVKTGVVASYIHNTAAARVGKIGVLVSIESTADRPKLIEFGKKLAMHIAASNPKYLNIDSVPSVELEHEKSILLEQIRDSNRPTDVVNKMIEGRIRKFYEEVVLTEQTYVIDGKKNVAEVVNDFSEEVGVPVKVSTFEKFVVGEGIEKINTDFAAEVQSLAGGCKC
ncbi:MAG: translation elongation factor Ts [Holosporales bacterium]|jgi:elongation factor Ts|nr:translation elongation factor Ts [Holosporales bacterium]